MISLSSMGRFDFSRSLFASLPNADLDPTATQLGVLGWSSEFSELVDEVKNLGFQGNMFTTTREAALEACVEILKLKLDIQMQLIVLFLVRVFQVYIRSIV
jgi:hypothetical protein